MYILMYAAFFATSINRCYVGCRHFMHVQFNLQIIASCTQNTDPSLLGSTFVCRGADRGLIAPAWKGPLKAMKVPHWDWMYIFISCPKRKLVPHPSDYGSTWTKPDPKPRCHFFDRDSFCISSTRTFFDRKARCNIVSVRFRSVETGLKVERGLTKRDIFSNGLNKILDISGPFESKECKVFCKEIRNATRFITMNL